MARRALSPACLGLVQAVESQVPAALAAAGCGRLRIGLSGGADSLALAAAVAWAAARPSGALAQVPAEAVVVDHGLQAASAAVAARAASQAEKLGLPARVVQVAVAPGPDGLEAAARAARYDALLDDPAALVLVAHTLDDQAETVLLGLARGSGGRSLAGMAARRGALARPFLGCRRRQTEQACRDWSLAPWSDPMNADLRHARVRVRQALAVLEEALGPGLAEALARTAELCAQDAGYLDAAAAATLRRLLPPGDPRDALAPAPISPKEALAPDDPSGALAPALTPVVPAAALVFAGDGAGLTRSGGRLPAAAGLAAADLAALPAALRGRVLRDWLRQAGVSSLSRAHLLAVEALVLNWHGQAGVDLPGGRVRRTEGRLRFEAA